MKFWRESSSVRARRECCLLENFSTYINFYARMSLVLFASFTNMDVITVALLKEEVAEECALLQKFMREDPHMIFRERREEGFSEF